MSAGSSSTIQSSASRLSLKPRLEEFLTFLYAQLKSREDVIVVLTSDGGMSPTQSDNSDRMRFNARQFEVIINAFLSARYGQDAWVLGYAVVIFALAAVLFRKKMKS